MNELTVTDIKQDEEHFLNELVESKGANLPAEIGEVLQVFEFTDWKAKAWKTMADKLSRLEDQQEAYHSALRSGQQWGVAALYAQKRMGEITREMPKRSMEPRSANGQVKGSTTTKEWAEAKPLVKNQYKDAECIASHPDVLDSVIEKSKQSEEIPTKTAVLREIRHRQATERARQVNTEQKAKAVKERPKIVVEYFDALKSYRRTLDLAVEAAKQGWFSDESIGLIEKKHKELSTLMAQLEAHIGGRNA